jgi:hypothetical protein
VAFAIFRVEEYVNHRRPDYARLEKEQKLADGPPYLMQVKEDGTRVSRCRR